MWTLQGLDALPKETVTAATKHDSPRVRRAAVQLGEPWLVKQDAAIARAFADLLGDADAPVRTQLFLAHRAAGATVPAALTTKPGPIIVALLEKERVDSLLAVLSESGKQGRQIYETVCTACHGPDGKGVVQGDKLLAPAFAKSEWFKRGGNVDILGRILLQGQIGPIEGVTYGEGAMIPFEETYTDEQLASVLNFIGQRWHNWKQPIAPEAIARVRKEIADRKIPWTHEELKAHGKPKPGK